MRHQRQGWRRLVALPIALLGALVIAPGLASAGPNTTGATTLIITDCQAAVSVGWSSQPGRLKTYTVDFSSNVNPIPVTIGSGALGRSGNIVIFVPLQVDLVNSNQFLAVTHVFDGKGVEQETWSSTTQAASCF